MVEFNMAAALGTYIEFESNLRGGDGKLVRVLERSSLHIDLLRGQLRRDNSQCFVLLGAPLGESESTHVSWGPPRWLQTRVIHEESSKLAKGMPKFASVSTSLDSD